MIGAKVKIDCGELHMELEGSEGFIKGELVKYEPLIRSQIEQTEQTSGLPPDELKQKTIASPNKKQKSARAPKTRCSERIRGLVSEGFFSELRGLSDVRMELEGRAMPYGANQVSAALGSLTKSRILRRIKEGKVWRYIEV